MVYRMLLQRGDYVISEEYTFATAVETSHPLGCKFVGVKMDSEGMLPDSLEKLLENWQPAVRGGARKPFLVYTVPSGQNPTGSTHGAERRKHIYKIAQEHDLIIVEDEPYYFLQMQPYTGPDSPPEPLPANHQEFIKSLIPSYLSMDVDGRVIRLDSFSKVLAPGSRCGWVTASEQVCERIQRNNEVSIQCPSGFSQVILHRLLDEEWGHCGYMDWLINLRVQYTKRRNAMLKACEKHLPKDIAKWTPPAAGMFHWIQIDASKHPDFGKKSVKDMEDEVHEAALKESVLVAPGSYFLADQNKELETLFFRATFAAAEVSLNSYGLWFLKPSAYLPIQFDAMDEAIRRFGVAIRCVFRIRMET
jgi:aromatic amino acid aminotransferase I